MIRSLRCRGFDLFEVRKKVNVVRAVPRRRDFWHFRKRKRFSDAAASDRKHLRAISDCFFFRLSSGLFPHTYHIHIYLVADPNHQLCNRAAGFFTLLEM